MIAWVRCVMWLHTEIIAWVSRNWEAAYKKVQLSPVFPLSKYGKILLASETNISFSRLTNYFLKDFIFQSPLQRLIQPKTYGKEQIVSFAVAFIIVIAVLETFWSKNEA